MIAGHGTRCRTERATHSKEASGTPTETFTTHLSSVRLKIDVNSESESERYRRESNRTLFRCYALPGWDIIRTDRIIPLEGHFKGKTLDVQGAYIKGGPLRIMQYLEIDAEATL